MFVKTNKHILRVEQNYFDATAQRNMIGLSKFKLIETYTCLHINNFHKVRAATYILCN
jgi:hypothetical protein